MSDYYLAEYDRWLDLCAEEYNAYLESTDYINFPPQDLIWEEEQYYEKADKLHDLDKEDGK